ncbi:DEAD-box ATP-dependent RNA helicase 1 [Vitis vinifera]|uniref:ATP-dependent RNA helicase n=1 Tax=Vitis vinifera TaxID=29760 RepID=A0A438HZY0_VITVI|nr:DEAD-box ATP-dependent RNA helicase 1 [Vitis vinifera]RVW89982.1 DEAD-box ATP-dependent RNA helicase 1 [Vitis vinifera]
MFIFLSLFVQVKEVFAAIAPAVGLSVGLAVGQTSIADEISELIKRPKLEAGICYDPEDISLELQSSVDILVATPGRLMDHINTTKGFTLKHLRYLVVDETDRLLREAYQSWLPTVLQLTRSSDESLFPCGKTILPSTFGSMNTIRRCGVERGFKGRSYPRLVKIVLSATLTQDPSKLALLDLHHPLLLTAGQRRYQLPEKLKSFKLICESKLKPLYLVALLRDLGGEKCIVFTSSVESAHRLCTLLNFFGDLQIKIGEYSGLQHQRVRRFYGQLNPVLGVDCNSNENLPCSKTLEEFRGGKIQVLISSDGMTRGMDVEGVRNVINYDVPKFIKTYIHRAGRTARAGQTGRCFTLLRKDEAEPGQVQSIPSLYGGPLVPAPPYLTSAHCPLMKLSASSGMSLQPSWSFQDKRFKQLLQKADSDSCPVHSVASNSIEALHSVYVSALEKLKETVVSETTRKRKINFKSSGADKRKQEKHLKE